MKVVLTIRATNGTTWETDDFGLNQKVDHVRKAAIKHFVSQNVMEEGDYALAVVRDGQAFELADSAKLEDGGVAEGSILALIVRGVQVDGCAPIN
jgi:hypothetical protein